MLVNLNPPPPPLPNQPASHASQSPNTAMAAPFIAAQTTTKTAPVQTAQAAPPVGRTDTSRSTQDFKNVPHAVDRDADAHRAKSMGNRTPTRGQNINILV